MDFDHFFIVAQTKTQATDLFGSRTIQYVMTFSKCQFRAHELTRLRKNKRGQDNFDTFIL